MSKHDEFIFTSISTVMKEAVLASSVIGSGIETYPLSEYIMQSLFLKMTGFQEQKMKCLAWEMATHDFEYRRILLGNKDGLGEYSSYNAKNSIYKRLNGIILSLKPGSDVHDLFDRQEILDSTVKSINKIFDDSNLIIWNQSSFNYFKENQITEISQFLVSKDKLFKESPKYPSLPKNFQLIADDQEVNDHQRKANDRKLNEYYKKIDEYKKDLHYNLWIKYEVLYRQRNRLAHNTLSYQHNLPTLKTLKKENNESRNYFIWLAVLLLIDNIFIDMYSEYKKLLQETIY